jgi:hypothetical protein
MILEKGFADKYLDDVINGRIKLGLGLGLATFDSHYRFKQGEFTIINGLDNVGKTDWILWYFCALSVTKGLKFCIWSGENKAGQLLKRLIQWKIGQYINKAEEEDIYNAKAWAEEHFYFIDNTGFYKSKELLDMFDSVDVDAVLIDPYTGMNREYTHSSNYDFLNEMRMFCNQTNKSLFVNTHPNTEAARRIYGLEHEYSGYPMPPSRSQSEGGQPFANRPDNFITIHRLIGHPLMKFNTQVYIRKIKDTETGGDPNAIDDPIIFEFNKGLGFVSDGINIINNAIRPDLQFQPLIPNNDFDSNQDPF